MIKPLRKRILFISLFLFIWFCSFLPLGILREATFGVSSYRGIPTIGNFMLWILVGGISMILFATREKKEVREEKDDIDDNSKRS